MTRPTIRILLPPRPATDSSRDKTSSPRSPHIYNHSSVDTGASSSGSVSARSSSRSPTITIRTRPSYKEDKRLQDSRPSGPRPSVQSPESSSSPPSFYNYRPSWYSQEHERQRRSSALSTRQPAYSANQYQYPPTSPRHSVPPARSSVSSASSASSAPSRRSSSISSSDYLYGEDFAYGAEPLQLQSRSRPSKTPAGVAVMPDQIAEQRRRRVRFVVH